MGGMRQFMTKNRWKYIKKALSYRSYLTNIDPISYMVNYAYIIILLKTFDCIDEFIADWSLPQQTCYTDIKEGLTIH